MTLGLARRRYANLGLKVLDNLPTVVRCAQAADPDSSPSVIDGAITVVLDGWVFAETYMSLAHGTLSVDAYPVREVRAIGKDLENWLLTARRLSKQIDHVDPEWAAWYRSAGRRERDNAKAMFTLVALVQSAVASYLTGRTSLDKKRQQMKAMGIFRDQATEARKIMSTTPSNEDSWLIARNQAQWCEALVNEASQ
jgi:hypothetical protein